MRSTTWTSSRQLRCANELSLRTALTGCRVHSQCTGRCVRPTGGTPMVSATRARGAERLHRRSPCLRKEPVSGHRSLAASKQSSPYVDWSRTGDYSESPMHYWYRAFCDGSLEVLPKFLDHKGAHARDRTRAALLAPHVLVRLVLALWTSLRGEDLSSLTTSDKVLLK